MVGAPVELRDELRPSDRDAIRTIVADTAFFRPSEVTIAVELVDACLVRGPDASGYRFLLAEQPRTDKAEQELQGFACFGPIDGTEGSFDLFWIVVRPEQQGHGLGRKLMDGAEARIAAAGGLRVYVETSTTPRYAPTRAFYAACGYQLEAELPHFYADGDGKAIYVKVLR